MRLRRVFHAFALWVLVQGGATAEAMPGGAGKVAEEASVEWGIELVSIGEHVAWAALPPPAPRRLPEPLNLAVEKLADDESYMDVYAILKEENACSRFFGGPAPSLEALNSFARRLRKKPLGQSGLSIRMSGRYTIYRNNTTGVSFRLFDEVAINSEGPFFIRVRNGLAARMRVGSFPITSRAARALTLLHELGHLLTDKDGKWLLPNDGTDRLLSERNTSEVEGHCLEQLLALRD